MTIPQTINILGHIYNVNVVENRVNKDGQEDIGNASSRTGGIWIAGDTTQNMKESALIHEIIEMLDYHLELKMEHQTISQIEAGLYQVLKDNNLLK